MPKAAHDVPCAGTLPASGREAPAPGDGRPAPWSVPRPRALERRVPPVPWDVAPVQGLSSRGRKRPSGGGSARRCEARLDPASDLRRRRGRVPYRARPRPCPRDDATLAGFKDARLQGQPRARAADGRVRGWASPPATPLTASASPLATPDDSAARGPSGADGPAPAAGPAPPPPDAERRQRSGLFGAVVASPARALPREPADLRAVGQADHASGAAVLPRVAGPSVPDRGAGRRVYGGAPQAPEEAAQRAVRVGCGRGAALGRWKARWPQASGGPRRGRARARWAW